MLFLWHLVSVDPVSCLELSCLKNCRWCFLWSRDRESNWACGIICSLMKDSLRMHNTKSLEVPESGYLSISLSCVVGWEDAGVWRRIAGFQQVVFETGGNEIHMPVLESWLFCVRINVICMFKKNKTKHQTYEQSSLFFVHVALFWLVMLLYSCVPSAKSSLQIATTEGKE